MTEQNGGLTSLLMQRLADPVSVVCLPDGAFASWHPAILSQFGFDEEEFLGKGLELLDRSSSAATLAEELQAAALSGEVRRPRSLTRKDGVRRQVDVVTVALRDDAGQLAGFGRVFHSLAQGDSQADLPGMREALNLSNIQIRNFDGTIEFWTKGSERLYGFTAEEACGRISYELLHTQFPEPLEKIHNDLLSKGAWQGELLQKHKDGRSLLISSDWVLLQREGAGPRIISTNTDITTRLETQQQLEASRQRYQRMAAELERSNEELEEFARIASHDLSAPIRTARWLTDLLTARHSKQLDEEGNKCLRQVSTSLQRMAELIDALLTHAVAGKGAISSDDEIDSDAALCAAIENLRGDIATAGAQIRRNALPKLRIQSQSLTQLFQNLLSNAIKYRRPEVAPQIEIVAARSGDEWIVEVKDNGLGLEKEWFERVFVPLQRRHGNVSGSGIGLATCKKIVTRAGGEIWVESEVGAGSAFYFSLPAY